MSAPPPEGLPDPEDVFDHLRREDGEHVGYIEMSADGRFIPYDRLWVRRGEAMELDEAEAVLDAIGLRLLAEDWLLEEGDPQTGEEGWARVRIREIHRDRVIVARAMEDLSATNIAKSVDLIGCDWLVVLEASSQLVGMRQDLVNSTGHRHHLRNFSRARMAWTMTIAVMP